VRIKEMCEKFTRFLFPITKCKNCGRVIISSEQDFCNFLCEEIYWRDEYYKQKNGTAKCVVCGKEFVKRTSTQETCSDVCCYKK